MSDNLKSLLARTNDILGQGKFFFNFHCFLVTCVFPMIIGKTHSSLYFWNFACQRTLDFWKTEKAKLLQVEAQEEMANEDLKTFEKSGNLPKLTPVLFNKRKESDILETHRGNYKRHWETSSRLESISNLISNRCPGSLKPGGGSVEGLRV